MRFLVIISFLFLSCNQKDDSAEPNEYAAKFITELNTSDTFRYEFPKNRDGLFDSSLYKHHLFDIAALNLKSLEKGFDSIQIRIFYGGSFVGHRLVIFKCINDTWGGEISEITYDNNPAFDEESKDYYKQFLPNRTIEYKKPKSGWNKFVQKLFSYNLLTIPDELSIDGFTNDSSSDRNGILIEIATKNVYRAYTSQEMDIINKVFPEIQNVSRILKLIDDEFSLKYLWDYTNDIPPDTTTSPPIKTNELKLKDIESEK